MIVHPPWREIADAILKVKDPGRRRELRIAGELDDHLEEVAKAAARTYEMLVNRLEETHPGQGSWALQAAQEIIVRDVLDPTT
jgi:hypothetical protein